MASLSNINGLFDVHSTGAILFSNTHGTSGQILKSNGNAAPTWVAASTVIGGPYLPLSGGTLTGATATATGISFTVGGVLTTQGPDGGLVLRSWTGGIAYGMLGTANMSGSEYSLLTDGTDTFLSGGANGSVYIRSGNNTSTHQLVISSTSAAFAGTISLPGTAAQYVTGTGALATFPSIPQGDVTSITVGNGLAGTSLTGPIPNLTMSGSYTGTFTATDTIQGYGLTSQNKRGNSGKMPQGHYASGETVWEMDNTWSSQQLADYFNASVGSVYWTEVADAPGGNCIYINGGVNVGGVYGSGFPYLPVETNSSSQADYYMEVWIQNVGTSQSHYMGSNEFNQSFSSLGGNPGSYGYWVMSNSNPGTGWTKYSAYIGGFGNSVGQFETGTKYWTPMALLNYGAGSGTRACRLSGWKVIKVQQPGKRSYSGSLSSASLTTSGAVTAGSVTTGGDVTGQEFYANGWFRNNNSSNGLYNQSTGNHWVSRGNYWDTGINGTQGIRLRNGNNGAIMGYLYSETTGQFGLLDKDGQWTFRTNGVDITELRANNQVFLAGDGSGNVTIANGTLTVGSTLTVSNGSISLGGTGRIQGIDTVSASTDAANKAYVDAHGGGVGPFLALAGGTMSGTITMGTQIFATTTVEGRGVFGKYNPSAYQHVWSMGNSYKLADNGLSTGSGGNLYGLAWSYNPNYGYTGSNAQSKAGLNHQLLLMQNGTTTFAAGSGMWTSTGYFTSTVTAPTFIGNLTGNASGTASGENLNTVTGRGNSSAGSIVVNGICSATTSVNSPIFYDSDNLAYYMNMAGVKSSSFEGVSNRTRAQLGITAGIHGSGSDYQRRPNYVADQNYWIGSMGWGTVDMNTVFSWGSGFIDSWSNPANQPSGTSHWVGTQALHYSSGTGTAAKYGWQMVGGPIGNLRFRKSWGTPGAWNTIPVHNINDGSAGSLYAGSFIDSNDTSYYLNPNASSQLSSIYCNAGITINGSENLYLTTNYGQSIVGLYNSTKYQGIFAMGNAYKLAIDGSSTGSLYGLAWSHPNAGGVAANLSDHGVILALNGNYYATISSSIRCISDMRTPIYYDSNNTTYYGDFASTSNINALNLVGTLSGQNGYFAQDLGIGFGSGAIGGKINIRLGQANQIGIKNDLGAQSNPTGLLSFTTNSMNAGGYHMIFQAAPTSGSDTNMLLCNLNGNLRNRNNSYGQYSDRTIKENITDATPKLEDIKKLKVKNFNFIGDDLKQIGLIAQETELVFPGLVEDDLNPQGDMVKSLKYSVLVPILVKAMQEQQVMIDDLKSRLEILENN